MEHLFLKRPWVGFAARAVYAAIVLSIVGTTAARADDSAAALKDRKIGYALTDARWAIYQTDDGKTECPAGYNEGPRAQFKVLYPNGGTVAETRLERESASRYPMDKEDHFPYREAQGKIAIGLNLAEK